MKYTSSFRIAACDCCSQILRDKINNMGRNETTILTEFKNNNLDNSYSIAEVKDIVKSVYFGNLANDKYGRNNVLYEDK